MEQITGIEPASSAWEADVLTIVLYLRDTFLPIKAEGTFCI